MLCLVGRCIGTQKFRHDIEKYGTLNELKEVFRRCKDSGKYAELYIFNLRKRKSILSWVKGE